MTTRDTPDVNIINIRISPKMKKDIDKVVRSRNGRRSMNDANLSTVARECIHLGLEELQRRADEGMGVAP